MSIEQRETDAYAERRRRQNLAMAAARFEVATEAERQRLADMCRAALPWQSTLVLRQVAALVGVTPPPWPQSEDAGQPWPSVDSGAEGGL